MFALKSLLFVPAVDERKVAKAFGTPADGVIVDLEDAVAASEKERARSSARRAFAAESSERTGAGQPSRRPARLLRINAPDTDFFAGDLQLVHGLDLDAIVLPKATPDAVAALGDGGPPVVAIIETARGLQLSSETAGCAGVEALALGGADLGSELGLETRSDGMELLYARSKLVVDSAAAAIRAPFDVVHLTLDDLDGLARAARLARSLGLRGKLCIHPSQVPVVNEVFSPTGEEVRWARRVIDAFDEAQLHGDGVLALDSRMVDMPVVRRARAVLSEGGRGAS